MAVAAERHTVDRSLMAGEDSFGAMRGEAPKTYRAVVGGSSQGTTVRCNGYRIDAGDVTHKGRKQTMAGGIPEFDGVVVAGGDQSAAVGGEGQSGQVTGVAAEAVGAVLGVRTDQRGAGLDGVSVMVARQRCQQRRLRLVSCRIRCLARQFTDRAD